MESVLNWITDLLFPPRCAGCNTLGADLCGTCLGRLKPRRERTGWIMAAAAMEGDIERMIYALKYRGMFRLAEPLGDWMAQTIGLRRETTAMFGANPVIVPVPLHPKRLRERGYNQAALLAQRLAAVSAMPLDETVLVRTRRTKSQVETQSRDERLENMRNAFTCPESAERVKGRDIVLVDDVCTTGATLTDCARALRAAGLPGQGASSVWAVVLARK